ncbi:PPR containing plant protein [Medicago truncatula]|uniref:PPR containing plant protein n=1 Tax=Medicago truncatula TaxID=3880 RepID=A0A072U8S7_MEDTR|nr:PPR containing plant protein [Medicago truncatula]
MKAEVAIRADNIKLAYYGLEFMARWIVKGERARPLVLLSVDEGLAVSALMTAGGTYNSELLGAAWAVLDRSLRKKKLPNPESYLAKIYALASLGHLQKAVGTLHDYENAYGFITCYNELTMVYYVTCNYVINFFEFGAHISDMLLVFQFCHVTFCHSMANIVGCILYMSLT